MTSKKTKDKENLDQATGFRLTERQFKAMLMCNMLVGFYSSNPSRTKAQSLAALNDFKEIAEKVLESCVLNPVLDV